MAEEPIEAAPVVKALRSPWTILGIGLVLLISVMGVVPIIISAGSKAELKRLLALARSKGIVTTVAEQSALYPPVPESQNAVPLYRQLDGHRGAIQGLDHVALRSPALKRDPAKIKAALEKAGPAFTILEQAALRPSAWFDRQWKDGSMIQVPEYARMRSGARILMIRADVRQGNGDIRGAVEDCRRIVQLAAHLDQEGFVIGRLIAISLRSEVQSLLTKWHALQPSGPWLKELESLDSQMPVYSEKQELRSDLFALLTTYDLFSEPGSPHLGVSRRPIWEQVTSFRPGFMVDKGRVLIAEGFLEVWDQLDKGPAADLAKIKAGEEKITQGLNLSPGSAELTGMTVATGGPAPSPVPRAASEMSVKAKEDLRQEIERMKKMTAK